MSRLAFSQRRRIDHLRRASYAKRMKRLRLPGGDLEYAVLAKLWEIGTGSARDIQGHIGEPAGLVYATTAKVLDRLCDKGLVTREPKGKAFSYRPKIPPHALAQPRTNATHPPLRLTP